MWDAVAKIEGKPLHRVLAERYNGGKMADKVFCYVGGGWYAPGKTIKDLQDEMRRHLDAGYTMVKIKVGGLPLAEDVQRVEAVKSIARPPATQLAVDANCKFGRDEALAYAKALAPFRLRWFEEPCDPLDFALLAEIAGAMTRALVDRREPVLDAGRREPRALRRPEAASARRHPDRPAAVLRHRAIRAHARDARAARLAAQRPVPARRQPDVARNRRRLRPRRRESYPGVFGAFAGFADDAKVENGYLKLSDRPGIGFEGQAALYAIMKEFVA